MEQRLRIGLLGLGHLGKIHLRCIQKVDSLALVGIYDTDNERLEAVAQEFGVQAFASAAELIAACEAIDIVTPTTTHFSLAMEVIAAGKHLFIEKPLATTPEEADQITAAAAAKGLIGQVGHVERFNPALLAFDPVQLQPLFIEAHRLATYNPRGTDVSVVLDLMIHDLDIILSLVNSPVTSVSASGVAIVSETPDIANARIEFANGCVANITASRISLKVMRKIRLFQPDAYLSLDLLEKHAEVVRLFDQADAEEGRQLFPLELGNRTRYISLEQPDIRPVNAIELELANFADAIRLNQPPKVTLEDGLEALRLATTIEKDIARRLQQITPVFLPSSAQ